MGKGLCCLWTDVEGGGIVYMIDGNDGIGELRFGFDGRNEVRIKTSMLTADTVARTVVGTRYGI